MSEFRRRNYGRGHAYYLGDRKLDGVTTMISKGLPKPALVNWAARTAAEKAVNEWDELAELPVAERLKRIQKAPDESRNAAAVKGTRIHAIADQLAQGCEVEVPEDVAGQVEACLHLLDDFDIETLWTECPVYHDKYLYAGTFDLIARINGKVTLVDFKTSASGAYGDTAFQMAAYKYATHFLPRNHDVAPMIEVDECAVAWLRSDGYSLYPYHVDESVFRQFLYIQQVARAAEMCRDYKGDELMPPMRSAS